MSSDSALEVVLETSDPTEAHLAQNILTEAGIDSELEKVGAASTLIGIMADAPGIYIVRVPEHLHMRAKELLLSAWGESE